MKTSHNQSVDPNLSWRVYIFDDLDQPHHLRGQYQLQGCGRWTPIIQVIILNFVTIILSISALLAEIDQLGLVRHSD